MASYSIDKGTQTTFVLSFFEDFYTKVTHYKEMITDRRWPSEHDTYKPGEDDEIDTPEHICFQILDELTDLLKRQAFDAPRFGGEFAAQYYKEALYVMVALADEVFLNTEWPGTSIWEDHLLESRFFGTHTAGETFFEKLDEFLVTRDPVRRDIAHIYLLALGLGFMGKYRNLNDEGRLQSYRRQLYVFVFHQEPNLYAEDDKLFPDTYAFTIKYGQMRKHHEMKPWFIMFGIIFCTLIFVSFQIWHINTKEINTFTNEGLLAYKKLLARES